LKKLQDKIQENIGFDGRIFLTQEEWMTYRRRKPVRYIRKAKPNLCEICGKKPMEDNPLENSHRIGFRLGIIFLGLTPEFVDRNDNIVSAHKKVCNKSAELDLPSACCDLKKHGIVELPDYLPNFIHKIWQNT
jgi:hypothetical protein